MEDTIEALAEDLRRIPEFEDHLKAIPYEILLNSIQKEMLNRFPGGDTKWYGTSIIALGTKSKD